MPHPRANLCDPMPHGGDLQPVKCLPKYSWGIGGLGIDRYKLKTPLKSITMAVFLSPAQRPNSVQDCPFPFLATKE